VIDLYTWSTPNGRKVSVMLEETGLPYTAHPVDIGKGQQFTPEYVAICLNSKMPVIVDCDGPGGGPFTLFESGAILIYLAEKTGRFLPQQPRSRYVTLQWLMFQMGNVGPFFGQAHHFMRFAKVEVPYAIERYGKEVRRLYGVMDRRLAANAFLAGPDYTIADIATTPLVARFEFHRVDLADFPNVKRWFAAIGARPPVQRGMAIPAT
jgi:GST-like protein